MVRTESHSMYRGNRRFSRKQLIFMVQAVMAGAFDRIEAALPPVIPVDEYEKQKNEILEYIHGCKAVVGMTLPIMFAQLHIGVLEDYGMGGCDFRGWNDFEKAIDTFVKKASKAKKNTPPRPEFYPIAKKFVDEEFKEYMSRKQNV